MQHKKTVNTADDKNDIFEDRLTIKVLEVLRDKPSTNSEIARMLQIEDSTVSSIFTRLRKQGIIKDIGETKFGRKALWFYDPKENDILEKFVISIKDTLKDTLDDNSWDDKKSWKEIVTEQKFKEMVGMAVEMPPSNKDFDITYYKALKKYKESRAERDQKKKMIKNILYTIALLIFLFLMFWGIVLKKPIPFFKYPK